MSLIKSFGVLVLQEIQCLYAVINNHSVKPVYVHVVWKLRIPPRVQIFLWLLSKNKLLTRDNLSKRKNG
jgi:hypothetical protein